MQGPGIHIQDSEAELRDSKLLRRMLGCLERSPGIGLETEVCGENKVFGARLVRSLNAHLEE